MGRNPENWLSALLARGQAIEFHQGPLVRFLWPQAESSVGLASARFTCPTKAKVSKTKVEAYRHGGNLNCPGARDSLPSDHPMPSGFWATNRGMVQSPVVKRFHLPRPRGARGHPIRPSFLYPCGRPPRRGTASKVESWATSAIQDFANRGPSSLTDEKRQPFPPRGTLQLPGFENRNTATITPSPSIGPAYSLE